jgi:CP family cyanate transporter-like MFS transporter
VIPGVLPWVASCILGIGLGGGFSLGLAVIVGYSADAGASSRLTAPVFLICFSMGAAAPVVVGALRDFTGGLTIPFALLLALAVAQLAVAQLAIGTRLRPAYRGTVA